jgi:hypothetical protein
MLHSRTSTPPAWVHHQQGSEWGEGAQPALSPKGWNAMGSTPVVYSYHLLPSAEQERIASLWSDGLRPTDFIYSIDQAGHVVGRISVINDALHGSSHLPSPVSSSRKVHKLTNLKRAQMISKEITAPMPGQRRKRSDFGRDLLTIIAWGVLTLRGDR